MRNAKSSGGMVLVLVATAAVFLNTLKNGFVWDDWVLMVYNDVYRSFQLDRIFFSKANGLEYLPVRDFTLALDARIWGMKPFGFHLTNLLLYLATLPVLFRMTRSLLTQLGEQEADRIAYWTTLVFALHPLHAEAVNFIAARNNILAFLFLSLSLTFCLNGIYRMSSIPVCLSAFFFVLALFSKASVIFYPFFLVLLLFLLPETSVSAKKRWAILSAFFLIDSLSIWVHFTAASAANIMNISIFRYGLHSLSAISSKVLQIPFFYIRKLLIPYPLSIEYPVSFESTGIFPIAVCIVLSAMLTVLAVRAWKKGYRIPVLGAAWLLLSLLPVLNIFPTSPIVADRYAYPAVFGFGLLFAALLKTLGEKKQEVIYVGALILAVWSGLSFTRNMDWRSDVTLFEAALSVNPDMDRSPLATALWNKGEYEKALSYFQEEQKRSGSYNYRLYQGRYLYLSGKYADALTSYEKALTEGAGALKEAHLFIAETYEKTGSYIPALRHYRKVFTATSLDPLDEYRRKATEGVDRIRVLLAPNVESLRGEASRKAGDPIVQARLAMLLYELGMYDDAEHLYRKALDLNSSAWDVWYNLGNLYMTEGKYEEAIHAFEASLRLKRDNVGALGNIAISYTALRKFPEAAIFYQRVLDLDAQNLYAAFTLGKLYFNLGERESAKRYLSLAHSLAAGNRSLQMSIDEFLEKIGRN